MDNNKLIIYLDSILGSSYTLRNGEMAYFCPFCNHYKRKLQVNLDTFKWHCWVCNVGGVSIKSLMKKVGVTPEQFNYLLSIIGSTSYNTNYKNNEIKDEEINLPKEFKLLYYKSTSMIYSHAMSYLKRRNISPAEILKYNIGYCESGLYKNRIIIPSYDDIGKLNYFVGRDIFPDSKMKYRNPPVSKNIIPFDLYINYNIPLILCEGVMDSISIRRNAIPMLGKFPSKKLIQKIVDEKVKTIYIALDSDAKKDSIKLSEYFLNLNIDVHLLDMGESDPSEMGYESFWNISNDTQKIDFLNLIKGKLYV